MKCYVLSASTVGENVSREIIQLSARAIYYAHLLFMQHTSVSPLLIIKKAKWWNFACCRHTAYMMWIDKKSISSSFIFISLYQHSIHAYALNEMFLYSQYRHHSTSNGEWSAIMLSVEALNKSRRTSMKRRSTLIYIISVNMLIAASTTRRKIKLYEMMKSDDTSAIMWISRRSVSGAKHHSSAIFRYSTLADDWRRLIFRDGII